MEDALLTREAGEAEVAKNNTEQISRNERLMNESRKDGVTEVRQDVRGGPVVQPGSECAELRWVQEEAALVTQ